MMAHIPLERNRVKPFSLIFCKKRGFRWFSEIHYYFMGTYGSLAPIQ